MDAILFSARPDMVTVDDAIRHLADHDELYWEVPFQIDKEKFSFPMMGLIHITGEQVEYRVTIANIIPHSPAHYEDPVLADRVKPEPWRSAWQQGLNKARSTNWRWTFIITKFEGFPIETRSVKKYDRTLVKQAPMSYVRILPPTSEEAAASWLPRRSQISEKNLETVVIENLGKVEPGLSFVERQLATPDAGRIDLLCKDSNGTYVIVELKKSRGSDQVLGQIQRYMGWVMDNKGVDKVRGIIIVQRKDRRLAYAVRAAVNIDVKEFGITFSSA